PWLSYRTLTSRFPLTRSFSTLSATPAELRQQDGVLNFRPFARLLNGFVLRWTPLKTRCRTITAPVTWEWLSASRGMAPTAVSTAEGITRSRPTMMNESRAAMVTEERAQETTMGALINHSEIRNYFEAGCLC